MSVTIEENTLRHKTTNSSVNLSTLLISFKLISSFECLLKINKAYLPSSFLFALFRKKSAKIKRFLKSADG